MKLLNLNQLLISSFTSTSLNVFAATAGDVTVSIDTMQEREAISPYIYGTNQDLPDTKFTARRLVGNRLTGFNWENGYSNAGADDRNTSDTFLQEEVKVPKSSCTEPGAVATTFHDQSLGLGVPYSIITLQGAGYVSADGNGVVRKNEAAPSDRWKEVKFTKEAL
ncbi:MAG: Beta-mannanase/endoglucanase A precursor [Firmicutes bacterium ADurb.Bin419]|nr:MAG: Beta-mannanase/endoglucanase A precursor [Firmicutes bacterium ADurb.Bin419]